MRSTATWRLINRGGGPEGGWPAAGDRGGAILSPRKSSSAAKRCRVLWQMGSAMGTPPSPPLALALVPASWKAAACVCTAVGKSVWKGVHDVPKECVFCFGGRAAFGDGEQKSQLGAAHRLSACQPVCQPDRPDGCLLTCTADKTVGNSSSAILSDVVFPCWLQRPSLIEPLYYLVVGLANAGFLHARAGTLCAGLSCVDGGYSCYYSRGLATMPWCVCPDLRILLAEARVAAAHDDW